MINKARLKAQLLTSQIQQTNNGLYQVILQLIDSAGGSEDIDLSAIEAELATKASSTESFLTDTDESPTLGNSRRLLAGTGITFDDSVANQRTINSSSGREWSILTDGDLIEPELIYAGGDVIMIHIP